MTAATCNKTASTATSKRNVAYPKRKGGPCAVCSHSRCAEFDKALVMGTITQAQVAREVGCHRSSVTRHVKNHLLPSVGKQVQADPVLADVDILAELRTQFYRMKKYLELAETANNWPAIRAFNAEARRSLELLAKLLIVLDVRPQFDLTTHPQYQKVLAVLLEALAPFPEARAAAAAALLETDGG